MGSPKPIQWLKTRNLDLRTVKEENIKGEWLIPQRAKSGVIFYIHGGGFVSCSAATHRPITAALARFTDFRVFAADYRLAPENLFPAALNDVIAAYRWLVEKQSIEPSEIALAGDSAGGGLVLCLLLHLRDSGLSLPGCAVCFSPWTDLAGTGESVKINAARCAMFYPENISEFADAYRGEMKTDDAKISPVFADFKNLPPILFQVGSTEILLDDSRRVSEKILASDGHSKIEIYEDVFHCWQMLEGFMPEATDALKKAGAFIEQHCSRKK